MGEGAMQGTYQSSQRGIKGGVDARGPRFEDGLQIKSAQHCKEGWCVVGRACGWLLVQVQGMVPQAVL
jgi:hypothetical protein